MEVIVMVVVFILFSMVIVGWYSNFSSMKRNIIKKGQAIFIASNIVETIKIHGKIPDRFNSIPGLKTRVIVKKSNLYNDGDLNNLAEVTVYVEFSDTCNPVCFTTGILLEDSSHSISQNFASGSTGRLSLVSNE